MRNRSLPTPALRDVLLLLLVTPMLPSVPAHARDVDHVIHISVDGANASMLADLLAGDSRGEYANFARMIDEGASTLNARTDFTHTNTLPNHTSMVTGRPVAGSAGHNWTSNGTPEQCNAWLPKFASGEATGSFALTLC